MGLFSIQKNRQDIERKINWESANEHLTQTQTFRILKNKIKCDKLAAQDNYAQEVVAS